jgi:hypothetical protein
MPSTAFDPTVHGFGFDNRFVNVVAALPGGLKLRTKGRCGGMTYAALDYFHLGRGAPRYVPSPPARVPPDGHPLANYLLRRQLESFANDSALRFVTWTLFPDHGLRFAGGVRRWTADEIPRLRAAIDRGQPVAVGLIGARTIGEVGRRNHQAVIFGYRVVRDGVDLLAYDPNNHGVTSVLHWRKNEPHIQASNRPKRPWRGLFVHDYQPRKPPTRAG